MMRRIILLGLALAVAGAVRLASHGVSGLQLTAIDVGQGDSLLLRTPGGADILIDTGPDRHSADALGHLLPSGDRNIELLVLTHPHADHIGGVLPILDHYHVDQVWESGVQYDAPIPRAVDARLTQLQVPVHFVHSGFVTEVEPGLRLEVLAPLQPLEGNVVEHDDAKDGGGLNDDSVVLRVTYQSFCTLLMGDASQAVEAKLVSEGVLTACPVLKVGHHGSRFSSTDPFLAIVHPKLAVISVGKNHYGHPAPATLRRLRSSGATTLRTDQFGTISIWFDGQLHIRTQRHPPP